MIICLCHRVSDRDIQRAVCSGTHCFDTLQDHTRVASSCGSCADCARAVFDEAIAAPGIDAGQGVAQVLAHTA